jgi:glutathione peroxidase
MVDLHAKYAADGLSILAFPCNQFGHQEPGTPAEIKQFALETYGVKFDLFEKIEVNGRDAHPVYKWLRSREEGFLGRNLRWNFAKFLIDRHGQTRGRYDTNVDPILLEPFILDLLGEK